MQKLKAGAERLTGPEIIDPRYPRILGAWLKLAFRARRVLIEPAASIPITHLTPFNQHRLTLCRPYFLTRDKNAKLIKESEMVGGPAHVKMPANAWLVGNPTTTARRHYILCLKAVRRHSIVLSA